jgi:hypothetical protein
VIDIFWWVALAIGFFSYLMTLVIVDKIFQYKYGVFHYVKRNVKE